MRVPRTPFLSPVGPKYSIRGNEPINWDPQVRKLGRAVFAGNLAGDWRRRDLADPAAARSRWPRRSALVPRPAEWRSVPSLPTRSPHDPRDREAGRIRRQLFTLDKSLRHLPAENFSSDAFAVVGQVERAENSPANAQDSRSNRASSSPSTRVGFENSVRWLIAGPGWLLDSFALPVGFRNSIRGRSGRQRGDR